MIESVIDYLSKFGDVDGRIIDAMRKIDRKDFVLDKGLAYVDSAMDIGHGQTISQPSTVARMLQLLELKNGDSVLEIGTGSGWNSALIANIIKSGKVTSTEISGELAERARNKIVSLGIKNVKVLIKDFKMLNKKFDKIIFTAGILPEQEKIIEDYAESFLKEGGILVCPYQEGHLIIIKKVNGKLQKSYTDETYAFVPLIL